MAQRSVASFKATKNSRFAANTSGDISSGDSTDMYEDVADSFLNITDHAYKAFVVTASGTDTYTATLNPSISAYATDQRYFVQFTNANTGAATLNFNSLGAKSIVKNGSTALASGDISAGQIYLLAYDGTNLQIVGKISSSSGAGSELQTTTVSVSSAEILALNTTPKQLIAAPGAGSYIQVLYGHILLTFGGTAYTNETTEIEYSTGQDIVGTITNFLNTAFDTIRNVTATTGGTYALSQVENASVQYKATTANPTTGNGTISINLIYRIVTV